MTQRIRRAVVDSGTSMELARTIAHKKRWRGSPRDWQSRLDHQLSDGIPGKHFDVDDLPDAILVTGDVSILAPAHAAVIAVQAREAEMIRAPMAKVRQRRSKERSA